MSTHYQTFVWLDSDTLVFDDMTDFLLQFIKQQEKSVYLVRDHAMADAQFVERWHQIAGPFAVDVPQACVMTVPNESYAHCTAAPSEPTRVENTPAAIMLNTS